MKIVELPIPLYESLACPADFSTGWFIRIHVCEPERIQIPR